MADTNTHQHLRPWRRHRKKTLEKVAEAIGSKVNTISGWETGNRGINLDDLSRLARVYEVSPADLLQSPEAYDQRQALDRLGAIANRMTPDQVAHFIWLGEAIIPIAPQSVAPDPPPTPKERAPQPPFPVRGSLKGKRVSQACVTALGNRLRLVGGVGRGCPAVEA
jgi:transcriptional regulator with XRE-family HTH domain